MSYTLASLSEFLSDGTLNIFASAYKDLRFNVVMGEYVTINADYEANLPGLSYAKYGTTDLWRALLYANGLCDPINDVIVGVRIGIPTIESLAAYFLRFKQSTTSEVVI